MKNVARLLVLTISLAAFAGMSQATPIQMPPDDIFGTPPPASVRSWVRLSVLGDRHHPFLIVWVSPQAFGRSGFERLMTLSPDEYDKFLAYTRSSSCLERMPQHPRTGMLLVTEHADGGKDDFCVLPDGAECRFLSGIESVPDVKWTQQKVRPIRDLATNIECG
jgi:hypothetical protein